MRYLRQRWAKIEALCKVDVVASAARKRLLDAVADEPNAELAALRMGHVILPEAEGHHISWARAATVVLDGIAKNAAEAEAAPENELGVAADGVPPDLRAALMRRSDRQPRA